MSHQTGYYESGLDIPVAFVSRPCVLSRFNRYIYLALYKTGALDFWRGYYRYDFMV